MREQKIIPFITLGLGLTLIGTASIIILIPGMDKNRNPIVETTDACVRPARVEIDTPSIHLTDLGFQEVTLDDYKGDVILLNTWATWCPPCRAEMPDLKAYYEKNQDNGFTLIGINIGETRDLVLDFALAYDLTFPIWLDPDETSLRALNTISLPYSAVIDRVGVVRYAWSGATCMAELERVVTPLILQ